MSGDYTYEMSLDEYQRAAKKTAIYPGNQGTMGLVYCVLGAAGEAGEMANKVKKVIRDDDFMVTPGKSSAIADEVGDTLWYLSQVCEELGTTLGQVAQRNLDKLKARSLRGTITGSGDTR